MLKDTITADLTTYMKAKDSVATDTIRVLRSAIRNFEIDKSDKSDATDAEIETIIQKEAKKRKEAIELYKEGGRQELVDQESKELEILQKYLPEQMSEEEVAKIVTETTSQIGASSPQDIGKVMGALMPKVKGKADGKLVNKLVQASLAGNSK